MRCFLFFALLLTLAIAPCFPATSQEPSCSMSLAYENVGGNGASVRLNCPEDCTVTINGVAKKITGTVRNFDFSGNLPPGSLYDVSIVSPSTGRATKTVTLGNGQRAVLTVSGNYRVVSHKDVESDFGGFAFGSNGYTSDAKFKIDRDAFQEVENVGTGLGPVFNNVSCSACHSHPVTGGGSTVTELRMGHFNGLQFVNPPGGSLIHSRSIHPDIQAMPLVGFELVGKRLAPSLLGLGYIEALSNLDIANGAAFQPPDMLGEFINVELLESRGVFRTGRFGLKCQHASLMSFAAEAYRDEMGITSTLRPQENLSNGRSVAAFDRIPDPEDIGGRQGFGVDVERFASFMRALRVPPRDLDLANTSLAIRGQQLFGAIGCSICHTPSFTTQPPGTQINDGTFVIPFALGNKVIFPFSDFLLHDIGTGDGIVMDGSPQTTANKFRTAPLWGVRVRTRLGHDGRWATFHEAIHGHCGQASNVANAFRNLELEDQQSVIAFLLSL